MKALLAVFCLLALSPLSIHAFSCDSARLNADDLRRQCTDMEREIHGYKRQMADIRDELSRYDSETEKRVKQINERIRKIQEEEEATIVERQKLMNEYKRKSDEFERGLYCSKCEKSQSEIEKGGRENFYDHIAKVKGKIQKAPAAVLRKMYEEYRRNWKISIDKTNKLTHAYDDLERIEIPKTISERAKWREALEARLPVIDDIAHKRALDYPTLLEQMRDAEGQLRKKGCF
jgi:chromosome segregation ATPase